MVLLALILSPTAAMSEPFHHKFGELREYYAHWLAVCPDKHDPNSASQYERTCWASTTPNNDGPFFDQRLSVSRDRTTSAIGIRFVAPNYADIDKSGAVTIRFSGGRVWSGAWKSSLTDVAANEFAFNDSAEIAILLAHMRRANWMSIETPMKSGKQSLLFSTIGLNDSLDFLKKYARRKP